MPDTRYLGAHPSTCSVGTPSTLAYPNHQDMTSFSTVSSFNFPATADATLLTPVSSAGSPHLPGHSQKGNMRNGYPQSSGASQQPTPPNTSRGVAYGFSPYDIASSNSSSPMTVPPHSAEYNMGTPYMGQSPNHHGHPSPKDEVPPPINPYLGHYSVSNEPEVQTQFPEYHNFNQVDPSFITRVPGEPMSHMHPRILTTTAGPTPVLAHPDPNQYRMQMAPRPGNMQDPRDPSLIPLGHPAAAAYQQRQATPVSRRNRVRKVPSQQKRAAARPASRHASRATELKSQDDDGADDEEDTLTLSDKCEDDLLFIFHARQDLIKSGTKGKGMWEEICRRYESQYGTHLNKPALQMRHVRSIAKYAVWPDREVKRLEEAYMHVEQNFNKLVLERLRETGGARCYNWTEPLIEAKMIELGYLERDINEQTNTRKRRRLARRRRAAEVKNSSQAGSAENWPHGLGLHPSATTALQEPTQHDEMEEYIPEYTAEQRDEYIESVLSRVKPEHLTSSPETDSMDLAYERDDDGRHHAHQQSTRVAKQAVEQLMLTGARI